MNVEISLKRILVTVGLLAACSMAGTLKDSRDGQTYKTVEIGDQTWMAENLNYNVNDGEQSWCYDKKKSNCEKYGRLYTWDAAKMVCPSGWHLPSEEEFEILLAKVGPSKEKRSDNLRASSWESGQDKYGFSALPAGYYYSNRKKFDFLGSLANFWSSTENNEYNAYNLHIYDDIAFVSYYSKYNGLSVRCLKDSNEERVASLARPSGAGAATAQNLGTMKDSRDGQTYKTVKIGEQTWMAENLNYKVNDGKQSWCNAMDPANCDKYGRLYTWEAARIACPDGWHLPSDGEWETLMSAVGGRDVAGKKLKSTSGWEEGGNGTDAYGFSVLPASYASVTYGTFGNPGFEARFWSSRELVNIGLKYDDEVAHLFLNRLEDALSVRCVQNSNVGGEVSLSNSRAEPSSTSQVNPKSDVKGTMKDSRDGQTYKTVKIGDQTWMAENLNYKTSESKCYDNKESNCKKYGRLYTWEAAKTACPDGWHLPSTEEFKTLLEKVGSSVEESSINLRASSWEDGKDEYGFSALPAGSYDSYYVKFNYLGDCAIFWSSTEFNESNAYYMIIDDSRAYVFFIAKYYGHSVRCLKDN